MPTWFNVRIDSNLREHDNLREMVSYAIQSQYSASKRILALAAIFQSVITITENDTDLLFDNIINIYTASGLGLEWWGNLLAVGRVIEDMDTGAALTLNDEYYRLLLLYKAMSNISTDTAETLNYLLKHLVDSGIADFPSVAYVLEVDTMVIRWVFEGVLNDIQRAVFYAAGTLARGAGVGWELYAVNPVQVFGFDGSGMLPFNQAPFAPDNSLIKGQ